MEAHLLVLS